MTGIEIFIILVLSVLGIGLALVGILAGHKTVDSNLLENKMSISQQEEVLRQILGLTEELKVAVSDIVDKVEENIPFHGEPAQVIAGDRCGDMNRLKQFENKYADVIRLYDQGLGLTDIAKRINMDKGQVQLIFNLWRKM